LLALLGKKEKKQTMPCLNVRLEERKIAVKRKTKGKPVGLFPRERENTNT